MGWFGQRHYIALICFLGMTINYVMRFCLSITITEMTNSLTTKEDPDSCPFSEIGNSSLPIDEKEFNWTEYQQGLVHSAFFWGYFLAQLPGGLAADKWGATTILTTSSICTSLFTILTPYFTRNGQWKGLIFIRIFVGLSQGAFYIALHTLSGHWIPEEERGILGTIIFSGTNIGNSLSMLLTGLILDHIKGAWDLIFYVYGILGFLWSIIFHFTAYNSPLKHPKLSQSEKEIFKVSIENKKKLDGNSKIPWYDILTSRPVWGAAFGMLGHDFILFAMVTTLPKFIKSVFHFNVGKNGILNAVVYSIIWVVSILAGFLVDFMNKRNLISVTLNRKIGTTISSVGPSLGLVLSLYSGCNTTVAITFLITGQALMGFFYSSLKVNLIDLSPKFSGTVSAIINIFGTSAGIYVPYLIGYLTPNNHLSEWRLVMWIIFTAATVTNIIYLYMASGKIQPWNSKTIIKKCDTDYPKNEDIDIKMI